jgi:hypothetical protein
MVKPTRRSCRRRHALTLPELEHSKAAVLNSLGLFNRADRTSTRLKNSFVGTVQNQG